MIVGEKVLWNKFVKLMIWDWVKCNIEIFIDNVWYFLLYKVSLLFIICIYWYIKGICSCIIII